MPLHHPPLPDDLVTFNVRGRIFQTTLTTLRRFRDSILYKMVKYEQQRMRTTSTESSSQEAFFVDRDPNHFGAILRYHDTNEYSIQTLATAIDAHGAGCSGVTPRSLLPEAQYYNIPSLEEAIELEMHTPAVKYEYCIIVPSGHDPTLGRWQLSTVQLYHFALSEEAAKTYVHHALDGLLDSGNSCLFETIDEIAKHKNLEYDDYNWSLWAATSAGEQKNMAIILRGDRKV